MTRDKNFPARLRAMTREIRKQLVIVDERVRQSGIEPDPQGHYCEIRAETTRLADEIEALADRMDQGPLGGPTFPGPALIH